MLELGHTNLTTNLNIYINRYYAIALALVSATVVMSSQAANAQIDIDKALAREIAKIVNKAIPLFGVDLPSGRESPTFIQNVTQLAKMGFDSPQNAKRFLQLDSIVLNSSKAHPGNVTLTAPTINHIISAFVRTHIPLRWIGESDFN